MLLLCPPHSAAELIYSDFILITIFFSSKVSIQVFLTSSIPLLRPACFHLFQGRYNVIVHGGIFTTAVLNPLSDNPDISLILVLVFVIFYVLILLKYS